MFIAVTQIAVMLMTDQWIMLIIQVHVHELAQLLHLQVSLLVHQTHEDVEFLAHRRYSDHQQTIEEPSQ